MPTFDLNKIVEQINNPTRKEPEKKRVLKVPIVENPMEQALKRIKEDVRRTR